jgi:enoyl-CoA hydratase/carnithine racemase
MTHVLVETRGRAGLIVLNKPEKLNAWDRSMREAIVAALRGFDADPAVGAVVLTGAGERAFCAGQDLSEAHDFDADRAEAWIREWEVFYGTLRRLTKPIVVALNGVAAGSAFQAALLGDIRVGHDGVRMGQPEINSGIASIMEELHRIGLVHHVVKREEVLSKALAIAEELAAKAPVAMRLDRAWFADMTEDGFKRTIEAAIRAHREAFGSGESGARMRAFLDKEKKR